MVSYRLSIVTTVLSPTVCHRMSPTLKSTGVVSLRQNLGRHRLTDVSQIFVRSGRYMGLLLAKESIDTLCLLSTMQKCDRQTMEW